MKFHEMKYRSRVTATTPLTAQHDAVRLGAIVVSSAEAIVETAETCQEMKHNPQDPSLPPPTSDLGTIEQGVASAAHARTTLAAMLRDADESVANAVYTALRAWVWKTLDGRRRDSELREWYALLESVEVRLGTRFPQHAHRIQVLSQLIDESIAVAESISAEQVLERDHVRTILRILATAPGGTVERAAIGVQLGLKQANLTRVLTLMALAGLIERKPEGRTALFRLTASGAATAAKLPAALPPDIRRPWTMPQGEWADLIKRMLPETQAVAPQPGIYDTGVRVAYKPSPTLPPLEIVPPSGPLQFGFNG
jgi:DNA-binding MarR family transcriptional regulator